MNTQSFFPSSESPRPLASNERLKALFNQAQEASAQVSLQKQYQESLTVDISKGENQGRQVFSKSIEFSLGVKAESSYEFKIPSPKEVASTVLGFVENRINSEKSAGASTERLNNLLEQARSGIEKGYKQAEKDIEALGLMTEELAVDIQQGRDLIELGLDDVSVQINGGQAPLVTPEEDKPQNPIQAETNTKQAENQKGSDLFSVVESEGPVESLRESRVRNLSGSINQLTENSADFTLRTQEGDKILIRFSDTDAQRYSRTADGESYSSSQSSRFEFSVQGDLSEEELLAINDLLAQVDKVSSLFFSEQFNEAFESAMSLGFDSKQIASFSLDLSSLQVQEVRSYQESSRNALDSYKRNQPLIGVAQQFENLSSLVRPLERFEKVNSMVEALVLKALERYSPETREQPSSNITKDDVSSLAKSLLESVFGDVNS